MNYHAARDITDEQHGQQSADLSNIEAEQALLGAILINNEAVSRIPSGFQASFFSEPLHIDIYEAVQRGLAAGKAMNPITVRSFMSPKLAAAKVGDLTVSQYLARLSADAVTIVHVPNYADAITDFFHRRQALVVGSDAQFAATRAQDDLDFIDRIKECRERLTAIVASIESRNEPKADFRDSIDETLDFTAEAMAGREPAGLDPGIPELMGLTGPWQKGQLIIIGGDVKQGKSALAWQTFFNIAEKHAVAGNSGEMPRSQIIMREKARRTGISAKRQKVGQVSEFEMQELLRAGTEMKRLKHMDIDCRRLTLEQVDEKLNRLIGEYGVEAFYIDHILKLAWTGKMEDAEDFKKANRATSTLKDIAMKRNIPIIALTHLNKTDGFQQPYGKTFQERINTAKRRRPTYKQLLGNIDKDADHAVITFQARPIIAAMEPEEGTSDYEIWQEAMRDVSGKAELILALSRENEFPRRREIQWNGATTSYGPEYREAQTSRGLF